MANTSRNEHNCAEKGRAIIDGGHTKRYLNVVEPERSNSGTNINQNEQRKLERRVLPTTWLGSALPKRVCSWGQPPVPICPVLQAAKASASHQC